MGFIRAMLKWGVLRKLVPHQVYVEAKFIPPLKQGKTRAPENPEREAVPDEVVERTLPFMSLTVAAMVQVQRMTGILVRCGIGCFNESCHFNSPVSD